MVRRSTELEAENLRLLKEGQSGLEKLNTVYAQLLAEQTALQKANKEITKLNGLLDESTKHQEISQKLATDALTHAEEAKKEAEEAKGQLAQAKEAFDQEKGTLVQQGYDACYNELLEDYTKQANDSYTNGYEEAYRLAWKEALKAAAVPEDNALFKDESIIWPSGYVPNPLEENEDVAEGGITEVQQEGSGEVTEPAAGGLLFVLQDLPPQQGTEPLAEDPNALTPAEAQLVTGAPVQAGGVLVDASHNNPGHGPPSV